jgi:hypothetical protein
VNNYQEKYDMPIFSNLHSRTLFLFGFLSTFSVASHAETWPASLKQALTQQNKGPIYSYQLNYMSNGNTIGTLSIDPTQASGKRTKIIASSAPTGSMTIAEFAQEVEKEPVQGIWCSRFAENIPASVALISRTPTTETYGFTPIASPEMDSLEKKVITSLKGEITISSTNPAVLGFSMRSTKAIKPMLLVRLDKFELNVTCARAPDGRTYAQKESSESKGSAMGQSLDEKEDVIISNLVRK